MIELRPAPAEKRGPAETVDYADLWSLKWHKGAKSNRDVDLSLLINMKLKRAVLSGLIF